MSASTMTITYVQHTENAQALNMIGTNVGILKKNKSERKQLTSL